MKSSMYQNVPVTCPSCSERFVSPVMTAIDVGQNPEAKALFLSGQVNIAVCPSCGHAEPHVVGQPCNQKTCPKCGTQMTRQ